MKMMGPGSTLIPVSFALIISLLTVLPHNGRAQDQGVSAPLRCDLEWTPDKPLVVWPLDTSARGHELHRFWGPCFDKGGNLTCTFQDPAWGHLVVQGKVLNTSTVQCTSPFFGGSNVDIPIQLTVQSKEGNKQTHYKTRIYVNSEEPRNKIQLKDHDNWMPDMTLTWDREYFPKSNKPLSLYLHEYDMNTRRWLPRPKLIANQIPNKGVYTLGKEDLDEAVGPDGSKGTFTLSLSAWTTGPHVVADDLEVYAAVLSSKVVTENLRVNNRNRQIPSSNSGEVSTFCQAALDEASNRNMALNREELDACPLRIRYIEQDNKFALASLTPEKLHEMHGPDAQACYWSAEPSKPSRHNQECCYDKAGKLMCGHPYGGTADLVHPDLPEIFEVHKRLDYRPWYVCCNLPALDGALDSPGCKKYFEERKGSCGERSGLAYCEDAMNESSAGINHTLPTWKDLEPCPPKVAVAAKDPRFEPAYKDLIPNHRHGAVEGYNVSNCYWSTFAPEKPDRAIQECCYNETGFLNCGHPYGGSIVYCHPKHNPQCHEDRDVKPLSACCDSDDVGNGRDSESCKLYYSKRGGSCGDGYKPPGSGIVGGDPHMVTWDQKRQSFQAVGEFWMVKNEACNIQIRTVDQKGASVVATAVFICRGSLPIQVDRLSISYNGTRLQQALNESATDIRNASNRHARRVAEKSRSCKWYEMFCRGLEVAESIGSGSWFGSPQTTNPKPQIIYYNDGEPTKYGLVTMAIHGGNMSLWIDLEAHGLSFEVRPPKNMWIKGTGCNQRRHGKFEGIWGDCDGDETNDFFTPTGTTAFPPDSSQEFLEKHWIESWRVSKKESKITYPKGESYETANDLNFKPNNKPLPPYETLPQAVRDICAKEDTACIYDWVNGGEDLELIRGTASIRNEMLEAQRMFAELMPPMCPALEREVPRGFVQLDQGFFVGSNARFECEKGYQLDGLPHITCLDCKQWSGPAPSCRGIYPKVVVAAHGCTKAASSDGINDNTAQQEFAHTETNLGRAFNLSSGTIEIRQTGMYNLTLCLPSANLTDPCSQGALPRGSFLVHDTLNSLTGPTRVKTYLTLLPDENLACYSAQRLLSEGQTSVRVQKEVLTMEDEELGRCSFKATLLQPMNKEGEAVYVDNLQDEEDE